MNTKKLFGNLTLLVTALIWGSAFVAQSSGMDYVGPWTFLATRSILGCVFLLPVILVMDMSKKKNGTYKKTSKKEKKFLVLGGICCGIALTIASALQQIGMQECEAGKAGFITAMYILLVPVLSLFFKKKVRPLTWFCVLLGIIGLYLLCMKPGFKLERGDIYVLLCAVAFSGHILTVDYFSPKTDGVKLSCIQFFTVFVLSGIVTMVSETPTAQSLKDAWLPICYAGIMSSGIGYTLQIVGQKYTEPTVASLLMSLESVFAVLSGIIILHQIPSPREWLGCGVMFLAIIISQLPQKTKNIPSGKAEIAK